jgi:hypothetical protein
MAPRHHHLGKTMRLTTRTFALALAGVLLAGCGHKDRNAPLAFVPADTPYVTASLEPMGDDARQALLAQADAQLPAQLAQMDDLADRLEARNPAAARLLRALAGAFKGNTVEGFAHDAGLDLKGRFAFYGLGLAPVLRLELSDPKAFDGFVHRFETAYGTPFDSASVGGQAYRRVVSAETHTQLVIATIGKQAVLALLPADLPQPALRLALGLDRPVQSLQDSGALADLAKARDYQPWLVGELDVQRLLPLVAGGKDPLFAALFKAGAERESAQTGEPVANLTRIPPSCPADAARIAARVPQVSFGYTRLDAKHQDSRIDVALASDITQAFAGLKVDLPGLGVDASAPFELSLALPMAELRDFWLAQADAVAATPFACPALADLNAGFRPCRRPPCRRSATSSACTWRWTTSASARTSACRRSAAACCWPRATRPACSAWARWRCPPWPSCGCRTPARRRRCRPISRRCSASPPGPR